jgi:pimeloyl-ACP methyl ester carboxylesterase
VQTSFTHAKSCWHGVPTQDAPTVPGDRLVKRTPFRDRLSKVKVPTLVICGSEDRATPLEKSQAIVRGITGARLVVLEGAGHMSAIEQPSKLNEVLVPFVRSRV